MLPSNKSNWMFDRLAESKWKVSLRKRFHALYKDSLSLCWHQFLMFDLPFGVSIEYHKRLLTVLHQYKCQCWLQKAAGTQYDSSKMQRDLWADMKPGLKRCRLKEEPPRPQVKSLAAVLSIRARLQCNRTWTWHASWSFREDALEPETKEDERVFILSDDWR